MAVVEQGSCVFCRRRSEKSMLLLGGEATRAEEEGSKEGEQRREILAWGISGDASSSFLGSRAQCSDKGGDKQGEPARTGAEVGECVVCREYIEEVLVKLPRRQLFPDGGSII